VTAIHVIVPDGIDDPARPSGGNIYDRRICTGLTDLGWRVHEHHLPGDWPHPGEVSRRRLAKTLASIGGGGVVLVDGLIASASADVMIPQSHRVHQVVLMHMPLGSGTELPYASARADEEQVVAKAKAVIATSDWTRRWLLDAYSLLPENVHVVEPGVDSASVVPGTADGGRLLCIAAVVPHKGQDILLDALGSLTDRDWTCTFVGSLDRDPIFAFRLVQQAAAYGIADQVAFVGPRTGDELGEAYAQSDLLVLPSRNETYGMVITEALARGVPVVATDVGGVPTALGAGMGTIQPGLLVPPADPAGLALALGRWLDEPVLRTRLRAGAVHRRSSLTGWAQAAGQVARVLREVAA